MLQSTGPQLDPIKEGTGEGPQDPETVSVTGSVKSWTSTFEFNHESFETFTLKVIELCHTVWPSAVRKTMAQTFITNRLASLLRTKKPALCKASTTFGIERLTGGSFNRVIGITVTDKVSKQISRYILRIPRFGTARPDRDTAILNYVRQHAPTVPVAEILATDFSLRNILGQPYVVQTRLKGFGLHSQERNFTQLTHKQQCTFAHQFGKLLRELFTVRSQEPGQIECTTTITDLKHKTGVQGFRIRPFDVDADLTQDDPDPDEMTITDTQPYYASTLDFLKIQFARWKAAALKRDDEVEASYMDAFSALSVQLDESGLLSNSRSQAERFVLCHLDLNMSPQNILVDVEQGELTITGILDWDSTILAPAFVACVPPMWIWAWSDDEPEDERRAGDVPASLEQRERKVVFEDAVGEDWLQYAYQPGYRIARKLCEFAVKGLHSSWKAEEADEMFGEWRGLKDERMEDIFGVFEGGELEC